MKSYTLRLAASAGVACLALLSSASISAAPKVPANLGSGLRGLLEESQRPALRTAKPAGAFSTDFYGDIIQNAEGAVLVNIVLDGRIPLKQVSDSLAKIGIKISATDANYHQGIIEGYVPLANVSAVAKTPGVQAVHLVHSPVKHVGKATTQGIIQHRIDKLKNLDGAGIKIGALSDSFNLSVNPVTAADDIASGDLPGPGNPFGRTTPVQVLQDTAANDEGRAMLQIVHDIAPAAKLAFATANLGEVSFANNIRALAAAGCNVIVDDVGYLTEPMFSDGLVARAVDDVTAAGISYFSSAGNEPATQAYRSTVNISGAHLGPGATIPGTNCILPPADVLDPSAYRGGFQNFATAGSDDALTVEIQDQTRIDLQWDDPYDVSPVTVGELLDEREGSVTAAKPVVSFPFNGTAGQRIVIYADADPTNGNPIYDLIVTLTDPAGNIIAVQDATTVPELLLTFLPVSGKYTISISGFEGATGDFFYQVYSASGTAAVTSDYNILLFTTGGQFVLASTENNLATGRPLELLPLLGTGTLQVVFARANTPAPAPTPASVLKCVFFDSGRVTEHYSYATPVMFGHNSTNSANAVAAYAFYPPFVPESFSSPGPVTIYFDKDNHRLAAPEVRLKPDFAAMDGANTTFFTSDVTQDTDTLPNFFGTSAAAPHAAAIAALVLQAHGGPGSVTPAKMKTILRKSAFQHDLDPGAASGTARAGASRVSLTAQGDGTANSQFDTDSIRVSLTGGGKLASITFDLSTGDPTQSPTGLQFDTRTEGGVGLPFTLGTLVGIDGGSITPTFQSPTTLAGVYKKLNLKFAKGSFAGGDSIGFGVDRDESAINAAGGSASLLGGGVLIPSGAVVNTGATFSGTLEDGTAFSGSFTNRIGSGFSPLDGFGFINAETAVAMPLP
ncbi:MAG TPA: S8 family serine peptidase [Opitutaceae bacterium]|nr:S8 family serine peptidase [Opitutaceae bacterium]